MLRRARGAVELVAKEANGTILGVFDDQEWTTGCIRLEPGDTFLIYTDGVTEAMNADSKMFGTERLLKCVQAMLTASAASLVEAVSNAVKEFVRDAPQSDDLTLVALSWSGPPSNA